MRKGVKKTFMFCQKKDVKKKISKKRCQKKDVKYIKKKMSNISKKRCQIYQNKGKDLKETYGFL